MPKRSGLGMSLFVGGFNASGDIQALGRISGGSAVLDFTDITRSAMERKGGKRTGSVSMTTFFNPANPTGIHHSIIGDLPTTSEIITVGIGATLGSAAASCTAKSLNYDPTRSDDGSFTFAVDAESDGFGLEWGRLLTAGLRTDSGATNGTGFNWGTGTTTEGWQAYLHVFAFTGTSTTITLQQSTDDGGSDAYSNITGGTFTTVTGATAERRSGALSLEQWTRVITTGTFSNLVFALMMNRNEVATVF